MCITRRTKIIYQVISFLFLFVCLFGTIQYLRYRNYYTLSSDESSEIVLGHLLATENRILTDSWYYSTELEVLAQNLVFSFFFHFTDNWHRVRIFATITLYLAEILAFYFLSKEFHFRRFFAITAALLVIPISGEYYRYMLNGVYYYPLVTVSFFTLALGELYIRVSGRKQNLLLVFSFICSIAFSLSGLRQSFFTYFPMLTASILLLILEKTKTNNTKHWILFSLISVIGSVIGLVINAVVLAAKYSFESWGYINFTKIDFGRIGEILNTILTQLGYTTGSIYSTSTLGNAACIGWVFFIIGAIWYAIKNRDKVSSNYLRLALFTLSTYVIYIVFYSFTDVLAVVRHNIPIISISFALVALFCEQVEWKKAISVSVMSALVLLMAASGLNYYITNWDQDDNAEIREVMNFLLREGYYNGYSTFWNANILTELSNGKIEAWDLAEGYFDQGLILFNIKDIDQVHPWLQKISHSYTHPVGKTYFLLTSGEYENNNWKDGLKEDKLIWDSSRYKIFGYEDYDDLVNNIYSEYNFVFGDNKWLENGSDKDTHREIYYGGKSYGPYQIFMPGEYEIYLEGDALQDAEVSCTDDFGNRVFTLRQVEDGNNKRLFDLSLSEKSYNVEIVVKNVSDDQNSVVKINSMGIRKKQD